MDIDALFRAAAQLKNSFTSAELAEELKAAPDEVAGILKDLSKAGIAEHERNKWRLTMRRTQARDVLVVRALSSKPVSRDALNAKLDGFTPAQVYTSLQRLILTGQAQKTRDGSRTPLYASAE